MWCPRFDALTHTGSMNIIMWPTGQKHSVSESSRGVKGLSASSMAGLAAQTPFDRSFHLDFWIALTGKPLGERMSARARCSPDSVYQCVRMNAIAIALTCCVIWKKTDREEIRRGQEVRVIHCVSIVQLSDERVWMSHTQARTLCE